MHRSISISIAHSLLGLLALSAAAVADAEPPTEGWSQAQRQHWAWRRPAPSPLPAGDPAGHPADRFIRAALASAGVRPAPAAPIRTLERRASFDLTGLPPRGHGSGTWSSYIDALLADPAFGEHWARYWLDLVRYADTNGYEHDEVRPDAWRYRDWVIDALNSDMPYDRFVRFQIGGDELAPDDPQAKIATGFNLLGPDMTDAASQAARRQNSLNDMTDTTALVFLGLTAGCARCHDHKYEPISQKDYFRLQAYFAPERFRNDLPLLPKEEHAARIAAVERWQAELTAAERELVQLLALPASARVTEAQFDEGIRAAEPAVALKATLLREKLRSLSKRRPASVPVAMGLESGDGRHVSRVLERGEPGAPGQEVMSGVPAILETATAPPPGEGRAALARWVSAADNPLTARVIVNRVWHKLFGRGLVPTPSDLGLRGESPTHPKLLDWLAVAFTTPPTREVPGAPGQPGLGWSIKKLLRFLMVSETYRQLSVAGRVQEEADPENLLFGRQTIRRLPAEAVRDSLLMVSGRLSRTAGGPGVFPPFPAGVAVDPTAWPVSADEADHRRRSIYLFVRRNLRFPLLDVFDSPDTNVSCARRDDGVSSPQALHLLNDLEIRGQARTLAEKLLSSHRTDEAALSEAYHRALNRAPEPRERKRVLDFLADQTALLAAQPPRANSLWPEGVSQARGEAWTDLCQALFNLNEFIYVD